MVLEGWELGNKGLYRKYWSYKKIINKFKILFWSRESEKPIFTIFPGIFTRKIRNTGISSETTIPGISSETTETRVPGTWCRVPGAVVTDFPFYGFFNRYVARDSLNRRLTRDSRNRRLTRDSRIPDFSRKNI